MKVALGLDAILNDDQWNKGVRLILFDLLKMLIKYILFHSTRHITCDIYDIIMLTLVLKSVNLINWSRLKNKVMKKGENCLTRTFTHHIYFFLISRKKENAFLNLKEFLKEIKNSWIVPMGLCLGKDAYCVHVSCVESKNNLEMTSAHRF